MNDQSYFRRRREEPEWPEWGLQFGIDRPYPMMIRYDRTPTGYLGTTWVPVVIPHPKKD